MRILFLYGNDSALELYDWLKSQGHEVEKLKENINNNPFYNSFLGQKYELIVSFTYRFILSKKVLNAVNGNAVNLHISYLPWNRGANPNQWSIIDSTPKGVTIHYMTEFLDKGDIITQKLIEIDEHYSLKEAYDYLMNEIIQLFKSTFKLYYIWDEMRKTPKGEGSYHNQIDYAPYRKMIGDNYNLKINEFLEIIRGDSN